MRNHRLAGLLLVLLLSLVSFPGTSLAQSAIAGQVRDESGAVLPGVTVEAASPVLIEKVRTVVTDEQGRFAVVELRPGVYQVTFTLTGFQTLVREGIELPANFTATINADLKVGTVAETVTVSGQSPVVDISLASRTQVLTREMIDTLPSTRNMQLAGYMVPGVHQSSPDVGGAMLTQATSMTVHGTTSADTSMEIDGMSINPFVLGSQGYPNDALHGEVAVETSAHPAEVSAAGVRVNAIPKDGGNIFSGALYLGGTNEPWQSSNLTPELKAKGVATPNKIVKIGDLNGSLGGPIQRDALWFLFAGRWAALDSNVVNTVLPNGQPAIIRQYTRQPMLRLTWQALPKIKMSAFLERTFKYQSNGDFSQGTEPTKASQVREVGCSPFAIGQGKITSTPTSRLLIETGYSIDILHVCVRYQPGVYQTPFTPAWYAGASHIDIITNQTTQAASGGQRLSEWGRKVFSSSASYVTGSHNFKTGFQWAFGEDTESQDQNADLNQEYVNGVSQFVVVSNAPVRSKAHVKYDLGIYGEDSWRLRRLTLNPGVRLELFNSEMLAVSLPQGRFAPARSFPAQRNLPNWRDVAPRFSAVYDLFGNATTAIKGSFSKYMQPWTGGFAQRYNPSVYATDQRDWYDCDLIPGTSTCSGKLLSTNGDGIAQDNEIGPSNNRNFATTATRRPGPGLRRVYSFEYTASVQHQLVPRVSVTGAYYRRTYRNLEVSRNVDVNPSDYLPFQVTTPLSGDVFTVYNLARAKQGLVSLVDQNSSLNQQIYNGFELSFTARLSRGINVFGGWTADQNLTATCDRADPNTGGGRFCDQTALGMPYRSDFKVAGNYPLPGGFDAAATFISYAGAPLGVNWVVPANLFPGGRTQAETVPLIQPGTKYLKRWNQLDANLKKLFHLKRAQLSGELDFYNLLNSSVVLSEIQTFGPALGQPQSFLQGRLARLAFQMKF